MQAMLRVVATGNGRKLRMMYGAYLSYGQLEEYADFMIREGLVYIEGGSGLYRLTPKGETLFRQTEHQAAAFGIPR